MPYTEVEPILYVCIMRQIKNETIEYCYVISLYPYICNYFKFPLGHLTVHVGDTCRNVDACLKMDGLIGCTIVPPKRLFHPVLPYINRILLRPLAHIFLVEMKVSRT